MSNIRNTIHRTIAIHERSNKSIHQIAAGIGPVKCEFADVFRVSEQGKGAGLTPIRLYFCVNKTEKVLYLLALGPKLPRSQQQDDINYCKKERNIRNTIHRTIAIHERSNKSIHQIAAGIGPVKCEFADVFRVSEQGKGAGLTPIRLYFCVNKTEKVLYLLALGPKLPRSQQQDDINYCKKERNIINSEQK